MRFDFFFFSLLAQVLNNIFCFISNKKLSIQHTFYDDEKESFHVEDIFFSNIAGGRAERGKKGVNCNIYI